MEEGHGALQQRKQSVVDKMNERGGRNDEAVPRLSASLKTPWNAVSIRNEIQMGDSLEIRMVVILVSKRHEPFFCNNAEKNIWTGNNNGLFCSY